MASNYWFRNIVKLYILKCIYFISQYFVFVLKIGRMIWFILLEKSWKHFIINSDIYLRAKCNVFFINKNDNIFFPSFSLFISPCIKINDQILHIIKSLIAIITINHYYCFKRSVMMLFNCIFIRYLKSKFHSILYIA